jgi:hypothetical protein
VRGRYTDLNPVSPVPNAAVGSKADVPGLKNDVRYWHLAGVPGAASNVCFQG